MKNKDYSGSNLPTKMLRVLIVADIVVFVCAAALVVYFMVYDIYDMATVMFAVGLFGIYNAYTVRKMAKRRESKNV